MSSLSKEQLRRGQQEGAGLWKTIGKWLKGANKWLKKSKVISKAGPVVGQLVGTVYPRAGKVISAASKAAKQAGYGPTRKCKSITCAQMDAMRGGMAYWLPSGGISLAPARRRGGVNPKNISVAQVNALRNKWGRFQKGGGVSLSGGGPSGYYAVTKTAPNITGRGTSLPGGGGGIKLAGEGKRRKKKAEILYY